MIKKYTSNFLGCVFFCVNVLTWKTKCDITVLVRIIQLKGGDFLISLDYKSGKSIHEQIQEGIKKLIVSGALREGDKLPSVRELSISLTVNPNTVQKAYKELEMNNVIYSVPGKGNFVAEVKKADEGEKRKMLQEFAKTLAEMKFSGVEKTELTTIINEIYKED